MKRLVGVITVKDGWAVQSIGYRRYLPLGRVEVLAENLDRWQIDEILIMDIDRSIAGVGPDFDMVEKVARRNIMTPLCYMGGIRDPEDAVRLVKAGADRLALETLFRTKSELAREVAHAVGRQAVIRGQAMHLGANGEVLAYDYHNRAVIGPAADLFVGDGIHGFSELLLIDWKNEGGIDAFSPALLDPFCNMDLQVICFGGITAKSQVKALLGHPIVSSVAIGNSLNYKELRHRDVLSTNEVHDARAVSYGEMTRGARQW